MRSTDSPSAGTRTEAFVLRRIPYGESDLVVHFATPAAGRVACFARAARSSRRRFPSGFPTLALLEVRIGPPPRPEGLRAIHECSVLRPNLGAASDLRRFAAACLLIEIARDTIPLDHPEPEAFGAVEAYLRSLDEAPFDAAGLLAAEMRLLAPLGHAPQIARCVVCDRIAPPRRAAFFDHRRGGIVCRGCGGGPVTLAAAGREAMLAALGPPAAGAAAAAPGRAEPFLRAHRALLEFIEFHLGCRFGSAALLEDACRSAS